MKKTCVLFMVLAVLLSGCGAARTLDRVEDQVENRLDQAENAVESALQGTQATTAAEPKLTREEAEAAALQHAGLTAAEVTGLRSEYEVDDGVPEWEIDFHSGGWEYDYTIHGKTGQILRSDKEPAD